MEELRNEKILFDDKELDELCDEKIEISKEEEKRLEDEIDEYFQKNKIEYED